MNLLKREDRKDVNTAFGLLQDNSVVQCSLHMFIFSKEERCPSFVRSWTQMLTLNNCEESKNGNM